METDEASNRDWTDDKLDQLILSEYPYPIAVNYKRLLDEQDWEKKTRACIQVFEYGLRAITLGLISQYLIRDVEKVSDPQLNQLLLTRLSRATLGTWNEMFFKALQAYEDKRNLFFMPELYDLYWDISTTTIRWTLRSGCSNGDACAAYASLKSGFLAQGSSLRRALTKWFVLTA